MSIQMSQEQLERIKYALGELNFNDVDLSVDYSQSEHSVLRGLDASLKYLRGESTIEEILGWGKEGYAGLGLILITTPKGLKVCHRQLRYSKISGNTLFSSETFGYSLNNSEISGDALWFSENTSFALRNSKISGNALKDSKNLSRAGMFSEISGNAFEDSKNYNQAFKSSRVFGNAFKGSKSNILCFYNSIISSGAFQDAKKFDERPNLITD